jgi:hypothetical protein
MKGRIQTGETDIFNNQMINPSGKQDNGPTDLIRFNPVSEILISEGNESFRHYIDWLGLSRDPKLVVLSSIHHYYYDAEEMMSIKTVVNLKELNCIKDISGFLHSMFLILPPKCFLIGCFVDNKKQSGFSFKKSSAFIHPNNTAEDEKNGIFSRRPFLNTIFSILDARPIKYLSGKHVTQLLRNNGFKVADMTELEGITYFCVQNERTSDN